MTAGRSGSRGTRAQQHDERPDESQGKGADMAERYTGYYERGPYPGEEADITRRQGGWLFGALALAVALTFVSVLLVATWPLAIGAWALVAVLWGFELVAKRAALRFQKEHGARFEDGREWPTPVEGEPPHPVPEPSPAEQRPTPPPDVPDVQSPGTPTL